LRIIRVKGNHSAVNMGTRHDNAGLFRSGDGRGRRKPLPLDVVKLCRELTVEAIQKQIEIIRMKSTDAAILGVQARCAENILNRGYGMAPATVTLKGDVAFTFTSDPIGVPPPAEEHDGDAPD